MSTAKHTSGPWEVAMGEVYAVRDSEGGRIALVTNLRGPHGLGGRRDEEEAAANTCLISAAPELLDVLQTIVRVADGRAIPGNLILDENSPLMDAARDAIRKATGEQQ